MSESPIVSAATTINVSDHEARAWFLSLKTHPERYQFETHAGFAFTQGTFGEIGARFETLEAFYGLKIALHFELTDVSESRFRFQLRHLPVWGAFSIEALAPGSVRLGLDVGANSRFGRVFLRLPLVKSAVRRQIQAEVDNIKASMENIYGGKARSGGGE